MPVEQGGPVQVGRLVDPKRTTTVPLGPCECRGAPHGQDTAEVRSEIGAGELQEAALRGGQRGYSFNSAASDNEVISSFTKSWTILDHEGKSAQISSATAGLLDEGTRLLLLAAINAGQSRAIVISKEATRETIAGLSDDDEISGRDAIAALSVLIAQARPLPNASGGRSRAGSPATASPRPRKPRR